MFTTVTFFKDISKREILSSKFSHHLFSFTVIVPLLEHLSRGAKEAVQQVQIE